MRNIWKPVLALGALFALGGAATAADRDTMLLSGGTKYSAATMTLGGQGTAAQAATEDTELTHGYKYRGYYGWGGGYGYRGYYGGHRGYYGGHYGGFRNYGYGGYYGGYRPYYGGWGGYRPYYGNYFSFNYYRPYYPAYYYPRPYYGSGFGFYIGISGDAGTNAPTVYLGNSGSQPLGQAVEQPVAPEGTFPYDGGPANPVPLPKADVPPIPPAAPSTDLPVSGKAKPGLAPATSPYKYKAYGEK
jgi:hypothetical protein